MVQPHKEVSTERSVESNKKAQKTFVSWALASGWRVLLFFV